MPKQLHLSAIVPLPDDMFARATAIAAVEKPWQELIAALSSASMKPETKYEEIETRTPANNGTKRGRKPRVETPPSPAQEQAAPLDLGGALDLGVAS